MTLPDRRPATTGQPNHPLHPAVLTNPSTRTVFVILDPALDGHDTPLRRALYLARLHSQLDPGVPRNNHNDDLEN